jgi:hypothetical protein
MDGVALAARFSLVTNRRQFCGPSDAEPSLYRACVTGEGTPAARSALRQFEALSPYLEAIGEKHRRDALDREVVEAYWIGNDLLEAFDRVDFVRILERLRRRGLPRSIAERLTGLVPDEAIPYHAFHVSFVGVGAVTGHVPTTVANMEECRPAWATVDRVDGDALSVRSAPLTWNGAHFALGTERGRRVTYDPQVLPEVAPGSAVAVHWGWPALVLTPGQRRALELYSTKSWRAAGASLPARYPGAASTDGAESSTSVA